MNIVTARRIAGSFVEKRQMLFEFGTPNDISRALAAWLRREAIAYHKRALTAARIRGRR